MIGLVDRPLSYRKRASDWIYKMLFLWSREPAPGPRAGPWFAWFATAVVLWRCRRRIAKAILAVSPLRLIRGRCTAPAIFSHARIVARARSPRVPATTTTDKSPAEIGKDAKLALTLRPKHSTGIKTRVKRLCTGDGPHVTRCSAPQQTTQQVNYRVTRSGRVYGKYPNKVVVV